MSRPRGSWVPVVYQAPTIEPPAGITPTPVTDGVLLQWEPVAGVDVVYIIDRSAAAEGPWLEIDRTTATRYLYSDGTNSAWYFRIRASINGRTGSGIVVRAQLDMTTEKIRQEFLAAAARDKQIAEEALASANKAREDAIAHADALNAALGDLVNADEWNEISQYPKGDFVRYDGRLYRAELENSGVVPSDNPSTWQNVGNYSSAGEAIAAALDMANQTANELEAEATRLSGVIARLPAGDGQLAPSAWVSEGFAALTNADSAIGRRVGTVEGRMPAGTGGLETAARVTAVDEAAVWRNEVMGQRVGVVEARMPSGIGLLATSAGVTAVDQARVSGDQALGQRIEATNAAVAGKAETAALNALSSQVQQVGNQANATSTALTAVVAKTNINANMLRNPTWARGSQAWTLPPGAALFNRPDFGPYFGLAASNGGAAAEQSVNASAGIYTLSSDIWKDSGSGVGRIEVAAHGASGLIGSVTVSADSGSWAAWKRFQISINAPSGTTRLACRFIAENSPGSTYFRRAKLEPGLVATMWTDDTSVVDQASATQTLEARMTVNENGFASYSASYTLALDVNRKVVGMRSVNDGVIGKITFSADVVEIIGATPGGGRNEFVGGKFYAYAPNGRRVVALGYGVT
ncbi:hypothetical protein M3O38_04875 [Xanthomonas nasturtii]|uniref:Chitin-binding type-3 domain-containing protein n=1 Tax=Xanthomonas nasturtii TaxID=1843581 RepID=A0ABT0LM79_9XANT|nr:hypothetical protein [Xanthomonas nasturtii]MCL1550456.1 hypothetical protein [Xanthomonas nasturtii]MCL1554754.1 hypothetical protein [Xanthomonas nasturtii]